MIAVELVDELVHSALGLHFLEPVVSFEDYPKVKSIVQIPKPEIAQAVTLMKRVEAKKMKSSSVEKVPAEKLQQH